MSDPAVDAATADFELPIGEHPETVLYGRQLRDGRIALGTRVRNAAGSWDAGEMLLLEQSAYLALGAWLSEPIREAWLSAVRNRREDTLQTASDLYGETPEGAERLAFEMLREIPPDLLVRALLLMVNSVGPDARERLVSRLNRTPSSVEDAELRRRLAADNAGIAYGVAAAALFDALAEDDLDAE